MMEWAWHQDTKSSGEKLVLLAIADHAGDTGECWPSSEVLQKKTGLSDRQVRAHIDALEARGLVRKVQRSRRKDGTLGTWTYRLRHDQRQPTAAGSPPPQAGHRNGQVTASGSPPPEVASSGSPPPLDQRQSTAALEPSVDLEPSVELKPHPPTPRKRGKVEVDRAFEAWWSRYPKKDGKGSAHGKWIDKLTWAERDAALATIERHVAWWIEQGTEQRFIPAAVVWLNQRRWEDEEPRKPPAPPPATGAVARVKARREAARVANQEALT